jgi:FAD synthase
MQSTTELEKMVHIVERIKKINGFHGRVGLTIGNFEGFHLGHREIITTLHAQSKSRGFQSAVITFKEHPLKILRGFEPERLSLPHEKLVNLKSAGVDLLLHLDFSREFADTEPEQFLALLRNMLSPGLLVLGRHFRFGRGNEGNIDFLRTMSENYGYDLVVVNDVMHSGEPVSSTRIRDAVKRGDFRVVDELLGHRYHLYVTGKHRLLRPLCMNCAFPDEGGYRAVLYEGSGKKGVVIDVERVEQGFVLRGDMDLKRDSLYRLQFSQRRAVQK